MSPPDPAHIHQALEDAIRARHSIRRFLPDAVPEELLRSCLELAKLAPSNSNTQPWRLFLATGPARERVRDALFAEAQQHGPNVPPLPAQFQHFRSEFGRQLYGPDGYDIAREDTEALQKARLRNYEFFGAPVVGVITMPKVMGHIDALGVGMYLQTLMLLLTSHGLGSCVQVSVAGYSELLRREITQIQDEERKLGCEPGDGLEILAGLAIGWPDWTEKVNALVSAREELSENVVFVSK